MGVYLQLINFCNPCRHPLHSCLLVQLQCFSYPVLTAQCLSPENYAEDEELTWDLSIFYQII